MDSKMGAAFGIVIVLLLFVIFQGFLTDEKSGIAPQIGDGITTAVQKNLQSVTTPASP